MSKIMDEMKEQVRVENALKMLESGELSFEDIAKYSGLPIEKVRELAGEQTA